MKKILSYLFVGIVSALVANVILPQATHADQFKFGERVTQLGDMVPQTTAQMTLNFQPIAALGLSYGGPIVQTATGIIGKKVAMVAGVATFTYPTPYTSAPICNAIAENLDASATIDYVVVSTTSCVYHSNDASDTRTVDFGPIIGNPN